ncbi:MAG: ROK family glucokinase [Clostridiales bacterium]|nr:ROK family glucokinase [Clostridiales bacterium]
MYYIGVDLGGTNIAAGVVNDEGKILRSGSVPTNVGRPFEKIIKDMADLVLGLIKDEGLTLEDIKSVGIGSPGAIKNGYCVFANNLGWHNVPLCAELRKYVKVPVYADNDANVAALAEASFGAAKGYDNSVTITLGTGVGGGLYINGQLYGGSHGCGAELGHMCIEQGGIQCSCGNRGCWEKYSSATALIDAGKMAVNYAPDSLIAKAVEGDASRVTAKIIVDAAKEGDKVALRIFNEYVEYIVMGLISIQNIFDPDIIAIGGGVAKAGDFLLDAINKRYEEQIFYKEIGYGKVVLAQMGNDAGIVGAAMLTK